MRLHLHNIGPIRDADIRLTPLTVLVGPNGTGKTTFTTVAYSAMQAHRVAMVDALEQLEGFESEDIRRKRGPAMARDVVNQWEETFTKRLEFQLRRCCNPDLAKLARAKRGGQNAAPRIEVGTSQWSLVFRLEGDELYLETEHRDYRRPKLELKAGTSLAAARTGARNVLALGMPKRGVYFPAGRSALVQTHSAMTALMAGAISGGYFENATIGEIPGTIADFMQMMARIKASRRSRVGAAKLARRIESELMHGNVRLHEKGGRKSFLFRPVGQKGEWALENVATSIGEISPLVLYLRHWAWPGDSILIDEPESHLHPEAQAPLAAALMDLSDRIRPTLVATHSELLVSALSAELLDSTRASKKRPARPKLSVHEFQFHDEDRSYGVDVERIEVEPTRGFQVRRFTEVADEVFESGIDAYNRLHGSD
jgi:predicted ATPase